MKHAFLRDFPRRMKVVGLYTVLLSNSMRKLQAWEQYGYESDVERVTLLFTLLLFIMEQSSREELCTLDDIATFIDDVSASYFGKPIGRDECYRLGDFLVNTVLSNDGVQMHFEGFDFERLEYADIPISYVANTIVYDANDARRTSYSLTESGYSLLLGTLEVESNMKLTIQEMIFEEHLKKRNFEKALEDIRSIFELMHRERLKNEEALTHVRRNILNFSIDDYSARVNGSFATIRDTRSRLERYKTDVLERLRRIEDETSGRPEQQADKIAKLKEITRYLDRSIASQVAILTSFQRYREVCAREMENYLVNARVERISFPKDVLDRVLDDGSLLQNMHSFLHPLFVRNPEKLFSLNKVFVPQRVREERTPASPLETFDFDEKAWIEEQRRLHREKEDLCAGMLRMILDNMMPREGGTCGVRLSDLAERVNADTELRDVFIPSAGLFKEVMIALVGMRSIPLAADEEEPVNFITNVLCVGTILREVVGSSGAGQDFTHFGTGRTEGVVFFPDVIDEGARRGICCVNLLFTLEKPASAGTAV